MQASTHTQTFFKFYKLQTKVPNEQMQNSQIKYMRMKFKITLSNLLHKTKPFKFQLKWVFKALPLTEELLAVDSYLSENRESFFFGGVDTDRFLVLR